MVEKKSSTPKHLQLREKLRKKFLTMEPDSLIPSANDLSKRYQVSVMTIRQSLEALKNQGVLYAIPGKGTFVSDQRIAKRLVFTSFSQEIEEKGMKPSSEILSSTKIKLNDEQIARDMQLNIGDPVYRIVRVRMGDGIPLALEESLISADLMPGLLDQDLKTSIYDIFKKVYEKPVIRAECVISPVNLNKNQANHLASKLNSPALQFLVIAFDARNRVLERCISIKRGDRYDLRYSINADS